MKALPSRTELNCECATMAEPMLDKFSTEDGLWKVKHFHHLQALQVKLLLRVKVAKQNWTAGNIGNLSNLGPMFGHR